jgi:glycosyltransferase involved in cell wall biosynthesis
LPEVAGEAALLVDPGSEKAIAAALRRLTEPAVAKELSAAGRERAAGFSWSRTAQRTLEVLRG